MHFKMLFFYDYDWNSSGEPIALKWRLSFEKNKLNGQDGGTSKIYVLNTKQRNILSDIFCIYEERK